MDEDEGEGEQGRGQDGAGRRHRRRVVQDQCTYDISDQGYVTQYGFKDTAEI